MVQRIATVAVYVEDQDKALEFWRDRVGFEVRRRESMGKAGFWLEVVEVSSDTRSAVMPCSLSSPRPRRRFVCNPGPAQTCCRLHAIAARASREALVLHQPRFLVGGGLGE